MANENADKPEPKSIIFGAIAVVLMGILALYVFLSPTQADNTTVCADLNAACNAALTEKENQITLKNSAISDLNSQLSAVSTARDQCNTSLTSTTGLLTTCNQTNQSCQTNLSSEQTTNTTCGNALNSSQNNLYGCIADKNQINTNLNFCMQDKNSLEADYNALDFNYAALLARDQNIDANFRDCNSALFALQGMFFDLNKAHSDSNTAWQQRILDLNMAAILQMNTKAKDLNTIVNADLNIFDLGAVAAYKQNLKNFICDWNARYC